MDSLVLTFRVRVGAKVGAKVGVRVWVRVRVRVGIRVGVRVSFSRYPYGDSFIVCAYLHLRSLDMGARRRGLMYLRVFLVGKYRICPRSTFYLFR